MRDVRRALLEGDVNFRVVKDLVDRIRELLPEGMCSTRSLLPSR